MLMPLFIARSIILILVAAVLFRVHFLSLLIIHFRLSWLLPRHVRRGGHSLNGGRVVIIVFGIVQSCRLWLNITLSCPRWARLAVGIIKLDRLGVCWGLLLLNHFISVCLLGVSWCICLLFIAFLPWLCIFGRLSSRFITLRVCWVFFLSFIIFLQWRREICLVFSLFTTLFGIIRSNGIDSMVCFYCELLFDSRSRRLCSLVICLGRLLRFCHLLNLTLESFLLPSKWVFFRLLLCFLRFFHSALMDVGLQILNINLAAIWIWLVLIDIVAVDPGEFLEYLFLLVSAHLLLVLPLLKFVVNLVLQLHLHILGHVFVVLQLAQSVHVVLFRIQLKWIVSVLLLVLVV